MNFCVVHLIVFWATFSEIPQLSDSTLEVMLNLIPDVTDFHTLAPITGWSKVSLNECTLEIDLSSLQSTVWRSVLIAPHFLESTAFASLSSNLGEYGCHSVSLVISSHLHFLSSFSVGSLIGK